MPLTPRSCLRSGALSSPRRFLLHRSCIACAFSPPTARAALIVGQARFESGNLKSAIRVGEHEYDCTLRNDMFTDGHTQWFFFCV